MGGDTQPRGPPDTLAMIIVIGFVAGMLLTPFIAFAALIIALAK